MGSASVAVARPLPVIVTFAVAVVADPPGAYCTLIVQLPPGMTTVPLVQLPPVMIEKTPLAGPLVLVTVGAAVSVSGPVAAAALLTVIVPLCVLVVPVTSDGVGPAKVTVAPVTVKATVLDVPVGVVTATVRAPSAAPVPMAQFAVSVVSDVWPGGAIVQVMFAPAFTEVAPSK